jgi:hypothetical protein
MTCTTPLLLALFKIGDQLYQTQAFDEKFLN